MMQHQKAHDVRITREFIHDSQSEVVGVSHPGLKVAKYVHQVSVWVSEFVGDGAEVKRVGAYPPLDGVTLLWDHLAVRIDIYHLT